MKKVFKPSLLFIFVLILGVSCTNQVETDTNPVNSGPGDSAWLIPENEVFGGGPGKDGIPAISSPKFIALDQATYLADNDLVIGIRIGDEIRAYSHPVLDWHEIVNDEIGGVVFSLNYCPLTGSGMAWNRRINGSVTTFGVSGLLYNTNLIPYDRATNSNWSQMKLMAVQGSNKGQTAELFSIMETTWKSWKEMYPSSKVISTETQYSRSYGSYPYGDYRTNDARLLFPISNNDTRLNAKRRVLGAIIDDVSKVYPIDRFPVGVGVISDVINNVSVVVAGSLDKNFAVIFERTLEDGTMLSFEPLQNSLPAIMIDYEGTKWDLFGFGLEGPRAGQRLVFVKSFISYWFAWGTFYPSAQIYGN